jgi:hypothetical protein
LRPISIGRNNRFVNRCVGRSTNAVDEAYSGATDSEAYVFNWPFASGRRRRLDDQIAVFVCFWHFSDLARCLT